MAKIKSQKQAKIKTQTAFAGKGCLVQLLALFMPILGFTFIGGAGGFIGLVLMVVFFVMGSIMTQYFTCSACGTRLANKKIIECPSCHREF